MTEEPIIEAPARSKRRAATEDALLDAFETVLVRDGIRRVSVNSVVETAGVGKPLLYRYFGDLPGLVRAWGSRRGPWHEDSGMSDDKAGHENAGSFRERIAGDLVANANALRNNPVTLELLADELTARSELSDAFREARGEQTRRFIRWMLADERYVQPENRRLIIILYAALTYLAMRSRHSPRFMGLRLDTDEGWNEALEMIQGIATEAAAQPDTGTTKGQRK